MVNIRIAIGSLVLVDLDLWRRAVEEEEPEPSDEEEAGPPRVGPVGFKQEAE